ncbi:unnamed protein product [Macrosiphum euphorbiae]|uniref:Uncharacterized protein n=2 Tax=Macrosiphum euphorbiae TaxID=13131 RepID=A0AAV0WQQ7_9HEMI|nr:unnamed protein product [Macrosiphum euphorbiae]
MAMTSNNVQNCSSCSVLCAEFDTPVKCDRCISVFHTKCTGLSPSELKCLSLKTRNLKYFYESCNNGLRDIPELKMLINRLLSEVNELKNQKKNGNNVSHYSEEFIINEIGDRNMRASNLILYNVPESNSDNTADRIAHGSNVVSNLIDSIIIGDINIKPVKLLRLGIRVHDKTRPIKAIFNSSIDVFEILKSKKKLLSLNPPSNIGISSNRTLYQRNYMKKLREKLESRRSSDGGNELIIRYVRGTPTIVSRNDRPNTRGKIFF